jgi:hypothetical protein
MDKAALEFAQLVEKMRTAQKSYFELMARARKSNHPDDFTNARKILAESKALERQVDIQCTDMISIIKLVSNA